MKRMPDPYGIYIHIPFCKQACHYCDFHFSTSLRKKPQLVEALCREMEIRRDELKGEVATLYLGGGTPSLLSMEELKTIFNTVERNFKLAKNPEITLEANPDDLSPEKIQELAQSAINRLSIGVQSFFEEDLKLMNRAHNASEAKASIAVAANHFENISIDLIYGIPGMSNQRWRKNLEMALSFGVPHLSCYALTIEPKTALKKFIEKGLVPPVDEGKARQHYEILIETMGKAGFDNYEFSNFGKPGFESRNNTAYWEGKAYLGIGPSAHSYDGNSRSWNVPNNSIYINKISKGELPSEREILSLTDRYNEYIMTGLRTKKGISLEKIEINFGKDYRSYLNSQLQGPLAAELCIIEGNHIKISPKGRFLGDGIASDLFMVE